MKSRTLTLSAMLFVLLLFLANFTLFTVYQGQQALKLHFGKLVTDKQGQVEVYQPGLHTMLPFVNRVVTLDTRLQTLDVTASRVFTVRQKPIIIDYYAKWRITDLGLYYRRTSGLTATAKQILQQQINDALRAAIGQRTLKAVVTSDRNALMHILSGIAKNSVKNLGITVTDVRIKGIELPVQVQERIYKAMTTKRYKMSRFYRSNGKAEQTKIEAQADAEYVKTIATAQARAQMIKAAGDAKAAAIYRRSYAKNEQFYAFYRGLQAYKGVFNNRKTIMVLKPDSKFFKYFNMNKDNHG